MVRTVVSRLLAPLLALLVAACATPGLRQDLPVVPKVDLLRYSGTWYEIATIPSWFQRDCTASTAEYVPQPDGTIQVINSCRVGAPDGPARSVEGRARVVDPATNAKLSVQFQWPFSGDYWIVALDPEYRYAMVGHPSRDYLWILSRTPALPDATYAGLLDRARELGYDPRRVVRTPRGSQ
jgi:apolipoprotein D and lipocalin family protein